MSETTDSEGLTGKTSRKEEEGSSKAGERGEGQRRDSGEGGHWGGRTAGRGRDRGDRDFGGRRGPGRFRRPRRKVCAFCVDKVKRIDYKDHQRLREFVSDRGKILKSRMTGTCMRHQRKLAVAIKRARHVALLPFVAE